MLLLTLPEDAIAPTTSSATAGVIVPTPTRLLVASTNSVFVSTVKSPEIFPAPTTSSATVGVKVLMPMRSLVASIFIGDPLPSSVSMLSKSVLSLVPHVSSDAPTSGFTSAK
jgi:hypothetical protein